MVIYIQLFRERLSEKVHATIPKGRVAFSSLFFKEISNNGKRGHGRMFASAKESNKSRFDSYSIRNSVLSISHITFRDCRVHSFSDNLSRNSCILTLA